MVSASAGQAPRIVEPPIDLRLALTTGRKATIAFLSGPVVPAGLAAVYGYQCGDPTIVDWLILIELGIVTVAWWLLALLSFCQCERLGDANPIAVADLIHVLGGQGLFAALLAGAVCVAHLALPSLARSLFHSGPNELWLWRFGSWLSGLFWITFLARWLGVCHYRRWSLARQAARLTASAE
jgi:hypothetical protein